MNNPHPLSGRFRWQVFGFCLVVLSGGCQFGVGPGSNEAGQILRVRVFEGGVPASVEFGNRWRVWQPLGGASTNGLPSAAVPPFTNSPLPFSDGLPDPLAAKRGRPLSPVAPTEAPCQ